MGDSYSGLPTNPTTRRLFLSRDILRRCYKFQCLCPRISLLDVWHSDPNFFQGVLFRRPYFSKAKLQTRFASDVLLATLNLRLLDEPVKVIVGVYI
jgi:hypothetical protein